MSYLDRRKPLCGSGLDRARRGRGWLDRAILTPLARWQRRRIVAALERLDEQLLAHVGIPRRRIPTIAASFNSRGVSDAGS
ncbi:hypothetical protein [Oceanibacterium hippocampi]|uniref:hypothetical protein n=1 Tax=Oceanibacterium hippocampi TaxID=745714 RepID=UPI00111BF1CC|nr:hypothetical protein [Oceanibacterium hippocampi]